MYTPVYPFGAPTVVKNGYFTSKNLKNTVFLGYNSLFRPLSRQNTPLFIAKYSYLYADSRINVYKWV